WGTVVARRAQKSPPGRGGWHIFHTSFYGVDCVDPTNKLLRANGDKAFFGWPNVPEVEAEIAAWDDAKTPREGKVIWRRVDRGRPRQRGLCPARHVSQVFCLAQERQRDCAGPAAVLLGSGQDGLMSRGGQPLCIDGHSSKPRPAPAS